MKIIVIRREGTFKSLDVFRNALKHKEQGLDIDTMRKRIRVLDALDNVTDAAESIELEDIEYLTLKQSISESRWAVADAKLLQIIDDVLDAKTPPKLESMKEAS